VLQDLGQELPGDIDLDQPARFVVKTVTQDVDARTSSLIPNVIFYWAAFDPLRSCVAGVLVSKRFERWHRFAA
jgi:hypothetical protein